MIKTNADLNITPCEYFHHEKAPEPCGIIIFGASGDLTHRKLIPGLYDLYHDKLISEDFFIVGSARTRWNDKIFRQRVSEILKEKEKSDSALQKKFIKHIYYRSAEYSDPESLRSLAALMKELNIKHKAKENIIFYFATPSSVYCELIQKLAQIGMISKMKNAKPWIHAVFEKPFGCDLESARKLNKVILNALDETQVYRIDHYLGKETVQNILIFRFANNIFETLWNRHYIDHVQITASEILGIEHRAGYYDKTGVLRDMFQNHMLQLLALIAMERPTKFESEEYRNQKLKVVEAIRAIPKGKLHDFIALGQYGSGKIAGRKVPAYVKEKGVPPHSKTETFAALKILIDNPRWRGVPFYLRSGKRLNHPMTEIAIHFKRVEHSIFPHLKSDQFGPNVLSFRIHPDEGIFLSFEAKYPGPKLHTASLNLGFKYKDAFKTTLMSAYERLLLDCTRGDQMLFVREDMVEASWKFITAILKERKKLLPRVFPNYQSGSWGPQNANKIINQDGRRWQDF
ncbi:MAG: glucose-6-phosphate dehydrogenase [Oligoflexia bacterium]|nr:glucose-6-phosphate dehydrogenase [Oligoflexia bacterium]